MTESANAPITALQIPKRKRNPCTNQAASPKQTTEIIKVKKPDSKSNVKILGTANTTRKIGLTNAVTIPKTAAELTSSPPYRVAEDVKYL